MGYISDTLYVGFSKVILARCLSWLH